MGHEFSSEQAVRKLSQARHDIRGSLNAVMGLSNMLAASDTLNPQQKEMADTLKSSAEDLQELIEDIFSFGQLKEEVIESGTGEPKSGLEPGKNRRILLVEDYEPTVLMMSGFLKQLGYGYDVARTGSEALEKFSGCSYDIVLMDLQLPDMDGFEITRRMRAIEKERGFFPTPIIATSGQVEDREICIRIGMNDCLPKPFDLEELGGKLEISFNKPRLKSQN